MAMYCGDLLACENHPDIPATQLDCDYVTDIDGEIDPAREHYLCDDCFRRLLESRLTAEQQEDGTWSVMDDGSAISEGFADDGDAMAFIDFHIGSEMGIA